MWRCLVRIAGISAICALAACSSGEPAPADMTVAGDPLIAARPYGVTLPAGHDRAVPSPLVIVLHGYSATGALEDGYLGISTAADAHGTIVAYPDGTIDQIGNHFWNATDGCCNVFNSDVDDVAYISALIADAITHYGADPKRIFLVGHSNGAFMAHRMACDRAELLAGVAAFAGVVWKDMAKCVPSKHLAVVQIHGDADDTILYNGGQQSGGLKPYPGAEATFQFWSTAEGCTGTSDGGTLDLDSVLPGAETRVTRATSCAAGGAAEFWHMAGGGHLPTFSPAFAANVYAFFGAHPRL